MTPGYATIHGFHAGGPSWHSDKPNPSFSYRGWSLLLPLVIILSYNGINLSIPSAFSNCNGGNAGSS